jgi:hypothetical protein
MAIAMLPIVPPRAAYFLCQIYCPTDTLNFAPKAE